MQRHIFCFARPEEVSMKTNLADFDRAARGGLGLFLLATPILDLPTYPYNLLGIVLIATSLIGYCPMYSVARWILPKRAPHEGGTLGGPHQTPAH
jgi:hypothetical protein